jgi:hypothetical protein
MGVVAEERKNELSPFPGIYAAGTLQRPDFNYEWDIAK